MQNILTYTIGVDFPEFIISTEESVFDRANKTIDLVLRPQIPEAPDHSLQTCMEGVRWLHLNMFVYDLNNKIHSQTKFIDIKILFHDVKFGAHLIKLTYQEEKKQGF